MIYIYNIFLSTRKLETKYQNTTTTIYSKQWPMLSKNPSKHSNCS